MKNVTSAVSEKHNISCLKAKCYNNVDIIVSIANKTNRVLGLGRPHAIRGPIFMLCISEIRGLLLSSDIFTDIWMDGWMDGWMDE